MNYHNLNIAHGSCRVPRVLINKKKCKVALNEANILVFGLYIYLLGKFVKQRIRKQKIIAL